MTVLLSSEITGGELSMVENNKMADVGGGHTFYAMMVYLLKHAHKKKNITITVSILAHHTNE